MRVGGGPGGRLRQPWPQARDPHGGETRTIPVPPELVRLLRAHIKRYGATLDGRIFQTARSGILQDSGYYEVWTSGRAGCGRERAAVGGPGLPAAPR